MEKVVRWKLKNKLRQVEKKYLACYNLSISSTRMKFTQTFSMKLRLSYFDLALICRLYFRAHACGARNNMKLKEEP